MNCLSRHFSASQFSRTINHVRKTHPVPCMPVDLYDHVGWICQVAEGASSHLCLASAGDGMVSVGQFKREMTRQGRN